MADQTTREPRVSVETSLPHLTGGFALTVTLDEVFHAGACREENPCASQQIITSGWGTVENHNSLRNASRWRPR
jgi:hypothetical protein